MKAILFSFSFAFLLTFSPSLVSAQTAPLCGEFVFEELFEGEIYTERTTIEDCDNPFGATNPEPFIPVFTINGETVAQDAVVAIASGTAVTLSTSVPLTEDHNGSFVYVYKYTNPDYIHVGEGSRLRQPINLSPGEYTIIFHRSFRGEIGQRDGWLHKLKNLLLPATALAYFVPSSNEVVVRSFTIEFLPPEPVGASSILFLPGIMGSHLYEESDECFGFGEQRRWFSHTDCEQLRLLTNPEGSSVNDIYTKFEDGAIVDKASKFGVTLEELYTNFIAEMNQLESEQTIKDFTPFAYDWRLRLNDVLRMQKDETGNKVRYQSGTSLQDGLLYKTIDDMANHSHSGKVTIVSHSNGGLVAKAFMAELAEANDPLEAKIDNLILIGSPQVGTPDAVNGILHGTEIGPGGVIINQDTTRTILNTAPFGHHLLPNKHYFDGNGVSVETPVITFKEGLATNIWRTEYGDSIDSFEELKRFLDDGSGRVKPNANDLKTPEVVDGTLLTYAEEIGDKLAAWQPPSTLTVHQLGGTGIWTPSRLEYSSNEYCLRSVPIGFNCDAYTGVLENKLHFVMDGDGTVVLPSALVMPESERIKRFWLDLNEYSTKVTSQVHKNMLEVTEVADFVSDVAQAKNSSYTYIKNTPPPVPQDVRLLFHLHSPLDMYVISDQGRVSSTTNDVLGAEYRRYGDLQYIWLPDTITNAKLRLVGYDEGSFTLFKELWEGEEELSSVDFKALPTNSGTSVTLPISFNEAGVMEIDFDGNGVIDGTVTETQDFIQAFVETSTSTESEVTEDRSGNSGTRVIGKPNAVVAGVSTASKEEQLKQIIELLRKIISLLKIKNSI